MTRLGPLHLHAGNLLLGDPGRRHLVLTADRIRYFNGDEAREVFDWREVQNVAVEFPTTRFRFPGLVVGFGLSLLALLTQDRVDLDTHPGTVKLLAGEEDSVLAVDPHHAWRYWEGSVAASQLLLDRLVIDEPSRQLLSRPEYLIRTATKAAKRRR